MKIDLGKIIENEKEYAYVMIVYVKGRGGGFAHFFGICREQECLENQVIRIFS